MYNIFNKKFENEYDQYQYIFQAIDAYTKNTGNCIDSETVIAYISVLKQYIETECPKKERNFLRLISLIKSSLETNNNGVTQTDIVFADLLSDKPDCYIATHYILVKHRVDNNTVFDILLFLKYNLMSLMNSETNSSNAQEIKQKYKKEMDLLTEGVDEAEALVDEEEETEKEVSAQLPKESKNKIEEFLKEYKPYKIKEYLDKYVIGQDEAKEIISTTVYNHLVTVAHPELPIKKNNIVMVGPSGCGKTEILRTLSKILPVPVSFFDTSGITQTGWKGDRKIKDSVKELVLKTGNVKEAENGIIFLDEFDKMCRPATTASGENVSIHIQGEALAMLEGTEIEISMGNDDIIGGTKEFVDTKHIMFICAGAFDGINDIVKSERNKSAGMGFNSTMKIEDIEVKAEDITKEMLIKFGVTPEVAGRLTVTAALNKLTNEDMLDILTKCEDNVISEIESILKIGYNCDVIWGEGSFQTIVDKLCSEIGARGLRSVVFELFGRIMYKLSQEDNVTEIKINKDLDYEITKRTTKTQKAKKVKKEPEV